MEVKGTKVVGITMEVKKVVEFSMVVEVNMLIEVTKVR